MATPAVGMPLAAEGTTTRSPDVAMSSSEGSAVGRLQALVNNGRAPKYLKLVLDLLVEIGDVIKDANRGALPANGSKFNIKAKN